MLLENYERKLPGSPVVRILLPPQGAWVRSLVTCHVASQKKTKKKKKKKKPCEKHFRGLFLILLGFPGSSAGKESACNVGDLGLIPGFGRFPGEGKGYPLQYSGLENSMDCIVHGDTKSQTQLSDFHFHSDLVINRGFCPDSQMPAEPPAEISSWISGSEWSQVLFPVLICSLNIWVRELAVFPSGTWEWREA